MFRALLCVVLGFALSSAKAGDLGKGKILFPKKPSSEFLESCQIYMRLLGAQGEGHRLAEDIIRDPRPTDVLDWTLTIAEDGRTYFIIMPTPALSAHVSMFKFAPEMGPEFSEDGQLLEPQPFRMTHLAGGETFGDFSTMNNFAGYFKKEKDQPARVNHFENALVLLNESDVGRRLLPKDGEVVGRDYTEGHLNPRTISRGEEGHFASVFHDARDGMQAILLSFNTLEMLRKRGFPQSAIDEMLRGAAETLRNKEHLEKLMPFFLSQRAPGQEELPEGIAEMVRLLKKAQEGELNESGFALDEKELQTLGRNLWAMELALSNQPMKVYYLGRAEVGPDGIYHIVAQSQPGEH